MKKVLFYSLGGSDIQDKNAKYDNKKSSDDQKRVPDFAERCKEWYDNIESNTKEVLDNIEIPLISSLLAQLVRDNIKPDQLVLFYTDQEPRDKKDTLWAYRLLEYIAAKTEFLGFGIPVVEGVRVQGNPSSLSEMMYLYNELFTEKTLRDEWNVKEDDVVIACFTAGTPAMSHHLIEAFSGLKYPKERYYYDVRRNGLVERIQLADLLRYDDVFRLVENMLYNRQFNQALDVIKTMQFTFLNPVLSEVEEIVKALHQWSLFNYRDALNHWKRGRGAWNTGEAQDYNEGLQHLTKLSQGIVKIRRKDDTAKDWILDEDIMLVIRDYYRKACYFWEKEQWQEFAINASSFYEWLLYIQFVQVAGLEFVKRNSSGKNWFLYIQQNKEEVESKFPRFVWRPQRSDRMVFIDIIKASSMATEIVGSWGSKMNRLYKKRNETVHALATMTGTIVKNCVGPNWPAETGLMLQREFHVHTGEDRMKKFISQFVKALESRLTIHLHSQKRVAATQLVKQRG